MTELEALKEARLLVHSQRLKATTVQRMGHWDQVIARVEGIISTVEAVEADPAQRFDLANAQMRAAGSYVTFWVEEGWIAETLEEECAAQAPPGGWTVNDVAKAGEFITECDGIGSLEAARDALQDWVELNAQGKA